MKLMTTLVALGLTTTLMGSEIDSFNNRYQPLEDSLPKVNAKANALLAKGVRIANEEGDGCNEKKLYKVMRKRFRNKYTDEFSQWASSTDELDRVVTPVEQSVYRDWKWFQAPVPGGWARWVKDPSASLLKVNGELIGDDKFEHFFGSGFAYFKKNYIKNEKLTETLDKDFENQTKFINKNSGQTSTYNELLGEDKLKHLSETNKELGPLQKHHYTQKGLEAALKHGFRAETGYMGATTTGVMAYGDLTANFNGMRFWNHMLQKREDILGTNAGPYVICKDKKWAVVEENPINFATYIDAAFDEGINCSAFNGKKLVNKIKARLREMERDLGERFACPVQPKKLKEVWKKYGKFAAYLINVEGHIVKPELSFEEYMKLTPQKIEEKTGFNKN